MALLLPNLNDKSFEQIVDEARLLIPSAAPEWTDHNVHDPGITFVELFAWLAEIEHYRVNRTSAESYSRFFSMMGLTPLDARPAQVIVAFELRELKKHVFVPAATKMWSIGNESLLFQTTRDLYLTPAKLEKIITRTDEREVTQTLAEENDVGHYEAFGPSPKVNDYLQLEFKNWFTEPQGHLTIELFENDLPARSPFAAGDRGFEPSATLQWEYRISSDDDRGKKWELLDVIEDGTLNLSRSGDLIFRSPPKPGYGIPGQLRALVSKGRYEIPPRIVSIRTNTIRAKQVETIVNEDLGSGLGTADQIVRLKKYPVLISTSTSGGDFQVGDVLDWDALLYRLRNPEELLKPPLLETAIYIATKVRDAAGDDFEAPFPLEDDTKYALAQAFNTILNQQELFQPIEFQGVQLSEEFLERSRDRACKRQDPVRRLNRFLLQTVFPDLVVSNRLEIQTGVPAERSWDEPKTWLNWRRVDNFLESGPDDRHFTLDPSSGFVRFGNGLNGKVPEGSEQIRARFYRYSQFERGNLPAGHQWALGLEPLPGTIVKRANLAPATGGREGESLEGTKLRSREVFRKEFAILTAGDYETLVLNTPGLRVARVKVLPNLNPSLPKLKLPGEVTIVIVPSPPPKKVFPNAPRPEPSDGFIRTVARHLESRRLVTTNIHVIGPSYVEVKVRCRVFLKKRASLTQALETIKRTLKDFFDPVYGGPTKGKGWPFGRSVFPSEVSQQLAKLPDVDYVTEVALKDLKVGEPLKLKNNGLTWFLYDPKSIELVPFEARGVVGERCKGGDGCG